MYQALYRKYRPQTFDDMVGQLAVTQTLKTQLQTGKLSHAYLFTGSRGTGKTSAAKILAKAVNCENPQDGNPCNRCSACRAIDSGACMDVLEIDAASNNGVDNVRDLRDDAIYTPSQVKMRVYIIDEVHMLSMAAFNALLKIIEEPPEHLLFILATTELHKVPATILSRCQRFSFRRISQEDIAARLQYVAYQENIELDDSAARLLARLADGGLRDGLSLLDQCASASTAELDADRVCACLGLAGIQQCGVLMARIADRDANGALELLNRIYADGKDMRALLDELICLVRDFMILQTAPKEGISLLSGVATDEEVKALSGRFSAPELVRMLNLLQQTLQGFSFSANRRLDTEICLLNLCQPELSLDPESLNARIGRLEEQLRSGVLQRMPAPAPQAAPAPEKVPAAPVEAVKTTQPQQEPAQTVEAPVGFWTDLAMQIRSELKPPISGFFVTGPNAQVTGQLRQNGLVLLCTNDFTATLLNKPEVVELVSRKASALLGRPVPVKVIDAKGDQSRSQQLQQLLAFGKAHSDVINILEE